MIKEIKTNIELTIYGYDPAEFMPVTIDGKLSNRRAYIAYKTRRGLRHLGLTHDNIVALGNHIDQICVQQTFRPTV